MKKRETKTKAMPKPQWKAGDVVVLRSGGPRMTVAQIRGDGACMCVWMDADGGVRVSNFSPPILRGA